MTSKTPLAAVPGAIPARRWLIVVAMVFAMSVSDGAITHYTLGVVLKYIVDDLHWTRGGVSTAVSLHLICMAISVPVFGALIDRFGARIAAAWSVTLFAGGLAATAMSRNSSSFLVLLPLAGLVAGATNVTPYVVTIANRFESKRGLALGIGAAGVGFGGIYLPRLVQYLSSIHGWRASFIGIVILVLALALPGALIALDRRSAVVATSFKPRNFVLQVPWRDAHFRLIAVSILLVSIPVGGVLVHAASLLIDRGSSPQNAALTVSFMGVSSVIGRIVGGYLMDRFHAPNVSAGFFLLASIGLALLLFTGISEPSLVGLICIGFTAGAEADAIAYLCIRYMRLSGLGRVSSFLITIYTISSAIGISFLGYIFDAFGSYRVGLYLGIVLTLTAAALIRRLGPYPVCETPLAQIGG